MDKQIIEKLNGLVVAGCKVDKVIAVCHPKNNFNPFLIYAICKSGDNFIHLEYREQHSGCGDYAWDSAYPFFIKEYLISVYAKTDCYGGWDNGYGEPIWLDESYKK